MSDITVQSAGPLLPVTVLTGFLGSGKTTLLGRLLRQPALARTAVIINELGETGLDHDLLRIGGDDSAVLLAAGCVCCTIRSDLADTLRELFQKRARGQIAEFDRVIIETTGMADPAPVVHTLISDPMTAARFRLDGVITTIDALNGDAEMDVHPEAVKQAAIADRLILTKSDIASPDAIARMRIRLEGINPAVSPILAIAGEIPAAAVLDLGAAGQPRSWLAAEAYAAGDEHAHHHHYDDGIRAFALTCEQPLEWDGIAGALDDLAAEFGARLLRVKGILNVAGTAMPVVVHGIQHLFHPPALLDAWPSSARASRLVVITHRVGVEAVLEQLRPSAPWRMISR